MEANAKKNMIFDTEFSFCDFFNYQKGISRPTNYSLEIPEALVIKWNNFRKWLDLHGASYKKILCPAIFTAHPNITYTGMVASEDIDYDEVIVSIPSSIIINTEVAYCSELNHIFKENPKLFSKKENSRYWEDYIMMSYILYEKQKGEKSFWYPYLSILSEDYDCLLNWDEEEINEVQDKILIDDAESQFTEVTDCWEDWYDCLKKYPEYFEEEYISFVQFKWCYILIYTRLFCMLQ